MAKLKEMVSKLQDRIWQRKSKINARIAELDQEYANLERNVKSQTNQLVQLEIEGKNSGQKELKQRIKELKEEQRSIQDKREAYLNTLNDDSFIKSEIPKLFTAARVEEKARVKEAEVNREKREKLEKEIRKIESQIDSLSFEADSNSNRSEAKALMPLLKYIEPRPVKRFHEELYLSARIHEVTGELLEQYIEPVKEALGPRNACIGTEYHPSTEEENKALEAARRAQATGKW